MTKLGCLVLFSVMVFAQGSSRRVQTFATATRWEPKKLPELKLIKAPKLKLIGDPKPKSVPDCLEDAAFCKKLKDPKECKLPIEKRSCCNKCFELENQLIKLAEPKVQDIVCREDSAYCTKLKDPKECEIPMYKRKCCNKCFELGSKKRVPEVNDEVSFPDPEPVNIAYDDVAEPEAKPVKQAIRLPVKQAIILPVDEDVGQQAVELVMKLELELVELNSKFRRKANRFIKTLTDEDK